MTRIYAWALSILGALGAIFTFGAIQRKKGKDEAKNEKLEEYQKGRERADKVKPAHNADDARDRLSARAAKRSLRRPGSSNGQAKRGSSR